MPFALMNVVVVVATAATMSTTSAARAETWYTNGNLHTASVAEWNAARYRNRFATAADGAVVTPHVRPKVVMVLTFPTRTRP